jgi:hypothetical protein
MGMYFFTYVYVALLWVSGIVQRRMVKMTVNEELKGVWLEAFVASF